jgi:hypothetical protein
MKPVHFTSEVWLYPGTSAWHFAGVPKLISKSIKESNTNKTRGFGSIPVAVTIGKTTWKTSIFPDKTSGTYLLPVKADVRKKESIQAGDKVGITLVL